MPDHLDEVGEINRYQDRRHDSVPPHIRRRTSYLND